MPSDELLLAVIEAKSTVASSSNTTSERVVMWWFASLYMTSAHKDGYEKIDLIKEDVLNDIKCRRENIQV